MDADFDEPFDRDHDKHTDEKKPWTFLTNHAHVLVCLTREPGVRLRDVAQRVGITERAVQRIIADLKDEGFITPTRDGRRNHYGVHCDRTLRHPVEAHCTVGALLAAVDHAAALWPEEN